MATHGMSEPGISTDTPMDREFTVTLPSETAAGQEVQERIIAQLERAEYPARGVFGMRLALEEAIVNAIRHGNKFDADKSVTVDFLMTDERVRVTVQDEGAGFDVSDVPDPTDEVNLDKPSGRGIMLMQSFLSKVEYLEGGTKVLLELDHAPPADAD